jgi:hypothetical protein
MNILMKDLVLAVSIMAVGTASVGARQVPAPSIPGSPLVPPAATLATTTPTNGVGPKIQFATPFYDFGRAKAGEPVKYTYVFTNTGDRALILTGVQPGCHCTTTGEWTRQVEPGKTGSVPIVFDSTGNNGPVFRQVTVTCNVLSQPVVYLQFRGTVYRPYDLIPPMMVLNVPPDAGAASGVVIITNNIDEPLMLSAPESNNRLFAAELITNAPGKGYQLIISTVPPMPQGYVQGQISLRTSWTNLAVISVPVTANVQPAVTVIPSFITLPAGPLAAAITNSVAFQNNGTNLLRLSEPAVNVPGVDAQVREIQAGKAFTALLIFPKGFQVPPGQPAELSVKSSNPKSPILKVPVLQMPPLAPPPARMVSPAPQVPILVPTPPARPAQLVRPTVSRTANPPEPPPLPPGF